MPSPPCRTDRGSSCVRRPSAFTGTSAAKRCSRKRAGAARGSWRTWSEPGRRRLCPPPQAGVRVVHVRTGIVQSARGASLKLLRPLFSVGLGGPLSPGSQWVSWIGLDDLLDVFGRALADDELVGPLNAVAPGAVTNAEYASTLARVMRRPALLKVPAFGPQVLLGAEGAREMVQASQRVAPARLVAAGHVFRHPFARDVPAAPAGSHRRGALRRGVAKRLRRTEAWEPRRAHVRSPVHPPTVPEVITGVHAVLHAEPTPTRHGPSSGMCSAGRTWTRTTGGSSSGPVRRNSASTRPTGGPVTMRSRWCATTSSARSQSSRRKGRSSPVCIENRGFGRTIALEVPGAGHVLLYQPRHPTAFAL